MRRATGSRSGTLLAAAAATALMWAAEPAAAQASGATEEEKVLSVVERLFDGMRSADSAAVRSVFHPDARLAGIGPDGSVGYTAVDAFVRAVGGAERVWDERFFDPEVRLDAELATVWTEYTFHVDGEFSHCGVDAFTLLKGNQGWRIVAIADTRRREGCERAEEPGDGGDPNAP